MNIIEEIKTRLNRYPNARYEIETALRETTQVYRTMLMISVLSRFLDQEVRCQNT